MACLSVAQRGLLDGEWGFAFGGAAVDAWASAKLAIRITANVRIVVPPQDRAMLPRVVASVELVAQLVDGGTKMADYAEDRLLADEVHKALMMLHFRIIEARLAGLECTPITFKSSTTCETEARACPYRKRDAGSGAPSAANSCGS
jgi:hypothetical protein